MNDKFDIQNREYFFPYHYIPHFDPEGFARRSQFLGWGLEYLCYLKQVYEFVLESAPQSVLDVGCGDGRFLGLLDNKVSHLVGCDLSEQAIAFAKAFYKNINYLCLDAKLVTDKFDVVTAIEVLEHIPDEQISSFVQILCERVKVGGLVIVCVPSTLIKLQEKHYRHYDEALLDEHIYSAKIPLQKIKTVRILRHRDIVYKIYSNLTLNKFYNLEIPVLNKWIWNYIWNTRFHPSRGKHIIAVYRRLDND